jgi:hypothetical protein
VENEHRFNRITVFSERQNEAHHNPKDKTLLHQPDIAVLHILRAKAAKFNRATSVLQKSATGDSD